MAWQRRRVNITRDQNIADQETLSHHPNVRNYLRFPWGYTLFEFYDPIFESLDNDEINPDARSEDKRARLALLMLEERKLLWPLYQGRPEHWQGNQLLLPLETGIYRVLDSQKVKWPWFGSSPGWESDTRIRISGRLQGSTRDSRERLENVFGEWASWAASRGRLSNKDQLLYHDAMFGVVCDFTEVCCDSCIGLYLLLTKTRKTTLLEAVGFFHPDEISFRFYEIGGVGVMTSISPAGGRRDR